MTSHEISHGTASIVIPPTSVPNADSSSTARPAGSAQPVEAKGPDASNASKSADATKGAGNVASRGPNGSGGLRSAVQELAASIECLCGDSSNRDSSGAKQHLDEAKRLLGNLAREGEARRTTEAHASPSSTIAGVRTGAGYPDVKQDLQRAIR